MAERRLRLSPNVAAVLVLALLAGGLVLWQRPWGGGGGDDTSTATLPADAASRLTAQLRDLSAARTESDFVGAAGDLPAARSFARRTWASLQAVAAPDIEVRYISGGDVADREDGSARAVAEVTWRASGTSGLATRPLHRSSVALRVAPQDDGGLSIIDAGPRNGTLPIWLAGAVTVDTTAGSTVVSVDGGDQDMPVDTMAATARSEVRRVVPGTSGSVTVISPRTQAQMADLVGQDVAAVRQIAAVTTRLDSRGTTPEEAVIVLNPAVFDTMDQRASQVVLTHEATHLLTAAVGTQAETWVIEGFADFVALRDDSAPLSVSAGQVLGEVRSGQVPRTLPSADDFSATGHGLGAVYESAWMVFRLLGERYGDARVVSFYEAVLGGQPLDRALRSTFDLTTQQLTADWRAYLTKSASTVS